MLGTNVASFAAGLAGAQGEGPERGFPMSALMYRTSRTSEEWKVVPADILSEYSVQHQMEYTEVPVEDGSVVSDHAIIRPKVFDIRLHATNTPILDGVGGFETKPLQLELLKESRFQPGGFLALSQGFAKLASTAASALGLPTGAPSFEVTTLQGPGQERITVLQEELETVWLNCYECKLVANGREWDRLFIQAFQIARQGPEELGSFNITLKQIFFATTGESTIKFADPAAGRNSSKANAGKKQAETLKSWSAGIVDFAGVKI